MFSNSNASFETYESILQDDDDDNIGDSQKQTIIQTPCDEEISSSDEPKTPQTTSNGTHDNRWNALKSIAQQPETSVKKENAQSPTKETAKLEKTTTKDICVKDKDHPFLSNSISSLNGRESNQSISPSNENSNEQKDSKEDDQKLSLNDLLQELRNKENSKDITLESVKWSSTDSQLQLIPILVKSFDGSLIQLQVSLEDSVQVIIQSLGEAAQTCYITSYYLQVNGKKVDEYITLSDIADLQPHSTFTMVEDTYDEKSARLHVRRVREILLSTVRYDAPNSCLLPKFSYEKDFTPIKDKKTGLPHIDTSIVSFYPPTPPTINCLSKISFSGWNPPPGNRRLVGDFFYLEIVFLEKNCTYHITACPNGFFVNETTSEKFDPRPNSKFKLHHSLIQLFQEISATFKKEFERLLSARQEKDAFEIYPVPFKLSPWVASSQKHTYDSNRSEDTFLSSCESDGHFRDWNEEFQSSKELPCNTIRERIIRDHAIIKVNNDFVEAATKGACAVINKAVPPLNPMDPKPVQMYIYNNIFFSYAIDTENKYEEVEGRYTYTSANNDLKGVMYYNDNFVDGLYTLATAIIDYRGFRMVAQSMIPGIFSPSTVVYNCTDFDKDPKFMELIEASGNKMRIPSHEIVDKNGKKITISCSAPTKGIIGTDGRRYIIDLCRVTPQDANFKGPKNVMAILRTEFLSILNEANILNNEGTKMMLNPDTFAYSNLGGTEEQKKGDEEIIENAASFLLEVLIPNLIQEFNSFVSVPVDGSTLTTLMHHRGINMRYLGFISLFTASTPFIQDLCIREMIVRAAKHILREILIETELSLLAPSIAHFLNCFLGTPNKGRRTNVKKKKKKTKQKGPAFNYTHSSLWKKIKVKVEERFQYDSLPEDIWQTLSILKHKGKRVDGKISCLRNFLQKMGIQIAQKDYDFSSETPFESEDITDIVPVVKHALPKTADGHDLLEAGVSYLAQGKLDVAFELLSEALVIFSQVYGPMHQATAICFSNMAMVLYQSGDPAEAAIYQQKAVIINERVQGLDHHETAQSYGNLALFCHKVGKAKLALNYIERALYLGYLACGVMHPDNGTSFTNIGMILQDLGEVDTSLNYFLKALECNESLSGPDNMLLTAAICHAIAVDYSLLNEYKLALQYEKRNYSIMLKVLEDENDPRIKESNDLLKQYTAKAVSQQMSQRLKSKQNQKTNNK